MLSEFIAVFFKLFILFCRLAHSSSNNMTDFELSTFTLGTYSTEAPHNIRYIYE